MELNCEIVRDLLPAYTDEMVSESTHSQVSEHLQCCADCRHMLAQLRQPVDTPVDAISRKDGLRRRIRRRVWLPALTVLLLLLTITCGVLVCATVPIWLTCEEAVVEVKPGAEMTSIILTDAAMEQLTVGGTAPNGEKVGGITFYGYRNHLIYPKRRNNVAFVKGSFEDGSLWYRGDCVGQPDVLLLGDGEETLAPVIAQAREKGLDKFSNMTLIYVVAGALLMGVVLLVTGMLLRKNQLGNTLLWGAVLCFCCAAACFFVSGGRLISYTFGYGAWGYLRRYVAVAVMTLLSWGTILAGTKTLSVYKK